MEIKMSLLPSGQKGTAGKIEVKQGDSVTEGQTLATVETKKGVRVIKATENGVVSSIAFAQGDEINSNQVLFTLSQQVATVEAKTTDINMSLLPGGQKGTAGKIEVKQGDSVTEGQTLATVETKKGVRVIKATENGVVSSIAFAQGDEISSNQLLFTISSQAEVQVETKEEVTPVDDIPTKETDLLVIGAGPGGYVAAVYAAKNGLKVTIVENDKLGGTCLNVGCIPTKAMVKSAEVYHAIEHAKEFGLEVCGDVRVNMERIIQRKDEVVKSLVDGVGFLMEKNDITVLRGTASFLSNEEVKVTGETNCKVKAKNIIIATGSKISKINIPGLDLPNVLNSTTILENTVLPRSLTIIGGGVIGMEFACIYQSLGVNVHVIEFMPNLLTMVDADLSDELLQYVKGLGMKVSLSSKVTKLQQTEENALLVSYEQNGEEKLTVSDKVLVAIGRQPNLEGLNLENTTVKMNEKRRGIDVDDAMKTNVEGIYAIGDVTNIIQLAHVASHQGIIAVDNIMKKEKSMHYHAVPNVIFTHPEIASVGKTETELKAEGRAYKVGKFDFAANGKAKTMGETNGFIKILKDASSNQVLGAGIVGIDASTMVSTLTLAVQNHMTDEEITSTIFAHPTTAEVIHEAAMDLGLGALHQ